MNVSFNVAEVPSPFALRFGLNPSSTVGVAGVVGVHQFNIQAASYAELVAWLEKCTAVAEAAWEREIDAQHAALDTQQAAIDHRISERPQTANEAQADINAEAACQNRHGIPQIF